MEATESDKEFINDDESDDDNYSEAEDSDYDDDSDEDDTEIVRDGKKNIITGSRRDDEDL